MNTEGTPKYTFLSDHDPDEFSDLDQPDTTPASFEAITLDDSEENTSSESSDTDLTPCVTQITFDNSRDHANWAEEQQNNTPGPAG